MSDLNKQMKFVYSYIPSEPVKGHIEIDGISYPYTTIDCIESEDDELVNKTIQLNEKYYVQHTKSEWHPFYYCMPGEHGMNSCTTFFDPIETKIEDSINEDMFDLTHTYQIECDISIKIKRLSKKEEQDWINSNKEDDEEDDEEA